MLHETCSSNEIFSVKHPLERPWRCYR